jgi:hypothetical protein
MLELLAQTSIISLVLVDTGTKNRLRMLSPFKGHGVVAARARAVHTPSIVRLTPILFNNIRVTFR